MTGCSVVGAGKVCLVILAVVGIASCLPDREDAQAEIGQLRQLAAKGEMDDLADALDRSMVAIHAGEFITEG